MMPWIYLLLSAAALFVAFRTGSFGLMAAMLLAALGLLVAFVLSFLAQRIGSSRQDEAMMLDPAPPAGGVGAPAVALAVMGREPGPGNARRAHRALASP